MSENRKNRRQKRRRHEVYDGDVSGSFCGRGATGEVRITPGFKISAKFVIHTVSTLCRDGRQDEPKNLAAYYRNSLAFAMENGHIHRLSLHHNGYLRQSERRSRANRRAGGEGAFSHKERSGGEPRSVAAADGSDLLLLLGTG